MTATLEPPVLLPRIEDASRLAEIAVVLARNGLVTVRRRGGGLVVAPRRQAPRAAGVALRRSFAELGPTFVKFGQLIASSPGLFPEGLSNEMRKLLDAVPAEPAERIRTVIARELGADIDTLFASFDDVPVAAASIAQVHRAVLHDGTRVAVKVRRPHLRRRIEQDLRLLRLLAFVLARVGAVGEMLNPTAIVDDLATTLRAELDFRGEAASIERFAANLATTPAAHKVVVPRVVDGMVSKRVLVMTYVDGVPVDDGASLRAAGFDLEDLVRTSVSAWLDGALGHGFFHGDVHAGNLFVTPAGEVAFLDFGIMGTLDDRTRTVLKRTVPALFLSGDFEAVVQAVFDLGAASPDAEVDMAQATEDVRALLEPVLAKSIMELSYGESLSQVLSVATKYHVVLPRSLVLLSKQLLYFERYARELAPDYVILSDPSILGRLMG
ncbi:MAG TPA: AarF/UbiB family protein [Acidimicrobiales bacterium]|nr:AarF/UbiB family protein [Acidimicrobiales bacterium]